jgi:hypothetical protein
MPPLPCSTRTAAIAVAVFLASFSSAYCQSPWDIVPNLPYTAHILQTSVQTLPNGAQDRTEERIINMRDSNGRTRIEIFSSDSGDKPNMVNLYIPSRRQFIQLMPGAKKAMVTTFPGTGPISTHTSPDVITVKENLPGKTINGIYATGTRIRTMTPSSNGQKVEAPYFGEHWVSPELKITVLNRYADARSQTTDEVQQLDRSEPDPALFEIPEDYKVVNVADERDPDSYNSQH